MYCLALIWDQSHSKLVTLKKSTDPSKLKLGGLERGESLALSLSLSLHVPHPLSQKVFNQMEECVLF